METKKEKRAMWIERKQERKGVVYAAKESDKQRKVCVCERERERERERKRERDSERQTDRDRQTDRQTERKKRY